MSAARSRPMRLVADWPCYHAAVRAGLDPAGVPVRPFDGVPWWEWHADRGEVEAALRHLPTAPMTIVEATSSWMRVDTSKHRVIYDEATTPGAAAGPPDPRGGRGS